MSYNETYYSKNSKENNAETPQKEMFSVTHVGE